MKAQRVEMFVCPSATPADTSGLQRLADAGKIKPETLVALVGKTEGTGAHDDWGRVWADVALREWTAKFLGIQVEDVAKQVIFVLSGGCPGVITPHIAAVTREWIEAPEGNAQDDKRLVVGRAGSDAIAPEEVGRMGMIRKVAEATHRAMADAALSDPKDVHLVMVKVPGLTTSSIKDAESRGSVRERRRRIGGRDGTRRGPRVLAVGRGGAPQLGSLFRGGDDLVRGREASRRGRRVRQLDHIAKPAPDRPFRDAGLHRR